MLRRQLWLAPWPGCRFFGSQYGAHLRTSSQVERRRPAKPIIVGFDPHLVLQISHATPIPRRPTISLSRCHYWRRIHRLDSCGPTVAPGPFPFSDPDRVRQRYRARGGLRNIVFVAPPQCAGSQYERIPGGPGAFRPMGAARLRLWDWLEARGHEVIVVQ